ncbi:HD domain-containing phosphohydrolase [uncultured Desulfobacter sp.]|uniref:HD-GYP domain-containing protein n=1 Tax=uncultured Desulfobacter sp. TaxID=240139 RepID=UPI002AA6F245|nr:HD domain-containing phosphohydrolase [uncultured Desulfobacter sp.]
MAFGLSILYVGSRCPKDFTSEDSNFSLACVNTPDAIKNLKQRPDIVLMDPFLHGTDVDLEKIRSWFAKFHVNKFQFSPAVFVIVPEETQKSVRLSIMEFGADHVVAWPLDTRELKIKAKGAIDRLHLEQTLFSKTGSLEKSFGYLDRFKRELKEIKDELLEDKSNLNTALKQIHQMSQERRRLKKNLLDSKAQTAADVEGFSRMLYTLIRQRVELNRGHGERVGEIACFIASQMGVSQKQLEDLSKAGMLHEIGLLFLSDDYISEKMAGGGEADQDSDSSTPTLYDQAMRVQFPVKGAQLLSHCRGFEGASAIIRYLNENVDGTGYPDGLKRHHIPLASRILAAADELDTLRENNRSAGIQALLSELEPMIGSRLDPQVAGWLEKYVVLHLSGEHLKVRGVGVEQLKPGMTLSATLFTQTGTKLLPAGQTLTRQAIDKIIQYHRAYPVDETVYIKV